MSEGLPDGALNFPSGEQVRDIRTLYERHWSELCGYLRKRFGAGPPEPQDVAQQTFLRYATSPSCSEIRNERAYLFRIAHNVLVEERRRIAARRTVTAGLLTRSPASADELTPERILMGTEHLNILRSVIDTAPVVRRRSFLLNRLDGLTCAEIARRTGYSESAVKKHVTLLLADLETAMQRAEARQHGLPPTLMPQSGSTVRASTLSLDQGAPRSRVSLELSI
jgi:RNA polymerase sigma-70 factor (ECF subfamily)